MRKYKLLLVEEDRMAASLLTFRLKKYPVEIVHKTKASVDEILSHQPDILLYGLTSGNFNGFQFIKELKKGLPHRVSILLAISNKQQLHALKNAGVEVDACLMKPINFTHLETHLTNTINNNISVDKRLS